MSNQEFEQEALQHFQVEELEQRYEMLQWRNNDPNPTNPTTPGTGAPQGPGFGGTFGG